MRPERVGHVRNDRSEEIRLRYQYRRLVLSGKARISLESAQALVGPDCAYHLYGRFRSRTGQLRRV